MRMLILSILWLSITLNIILLYRFVWTRPSRIREITKKGFLAAVAFGGTVLVLEFVFMYFMVASDGFGVTLSSQTWFRRHWKPINSRGYRDVEHDISKLSEKNVLFVVGDSFVAGHGTEDYRQRFPDVLAAKLGRKWEVFNIAENGWGTHAEFAAMQDMGITPDAVILSYFVNDIEGAARKVGTPPPVSMIPQPHWLIRPVVARSYVLNFCYWRLVRLKPSRRTYLDYLDSAYEDEKIWSVHEQELRQFVDYARQANTRLIVVVFPHLADIKRSKANTDKVVEFFRSCEVPVIDLAPLLADRDTRELVVNPMDAHPSVSLHKEIAALLAPLVEHSLEAAPPEE